MSESSESQRKSAAHVAEQLAETILASQQDRAIKGIFNKDQLKLIDRWIEHQAEPLDRAESIRRLVELGLKVKK